MKNAEKIFMAINNVDERLIDEAKGRDEKPVLIRVEKHLPIKEIIASAACFVLLTVGIFAMFKFRIENVDIIDSSVNTNSSTEEPDTPENMELQAILKDLTANAVEIDGIFTRLAEQGEGYYSTSRIRRYYPAGDNRKTEPLGLFTVPQTCSELEQLLHTCFTERSVEHYMNDVAAGHLTTGDDGETVITVDSSNAYRLKLIEADGKLYHTLVSYYDVKLDIDHTTAMVTSKTDKTIKFTYWDTNGVFSETEGVIVLEDGAWKFDYFYDTGFAPVMPTEFTEEDKELQGILDELSAGNGLYGWFCRGISLDEGNYMFRNSIDSDTPYEYTVLPKGKKDFNYSSLEYPQSCEQLEELLMKYFTRENVDKFMKNAVKGTMSKNFDGTYTVTAETKRKNLPVFLEIDGNMYLWLRSATGPMYTPVWNTAKLTEKTDDCIKFTMVYTIYDEYAAMDGLIKYERGGWKLNYDWDLLTGESSELPDETIEENAKLREILKGLAANAAELDGMFTEDTELSSNKNSYPLKVNEVDYSGAYYPIADEDRTEPNGLFAKPKTKSELEAMLLTTFTGRAVESYMQHVGTGIFVTDTDGSTVINETSKGYGHKTFLEINGRLYHDPSDSIFKWYCDPETAKVISKTDKTIRFSYWGNGDWDDSTGTVIFEDGGWKLDFFGAGSSVGFVPELPTEFTEEDNELNDILNELSAAVTLRGWFYNGAYTTQGGIFKSSNDPDSYGYEYSLLPKDEGYPQSCGQIEEMLLKYFTKEIANQFMRSVEKGTMTENPDGTFTVTTESGDKYLPAFLEIDGQMYVKDNYRGGPGAPVWGTAQVTEKSSDEIKFSIIYEMYNDFFPGKGSIKYERGGWRLNYDPIDYGG